jgi:hypothetical protein
MASYELQSLAQQAATSAKRAVIRMRTVELGGFNDKTRESILTEANKSALIARREVYLSHGYTECGCTALVNPRFARCYQCGAWRMTTANDDTSIGAEVSSLDSKRYAGESPFILPR